MHINIADIAVGGLLVVTALMLLAHFRKQPDSPRTKKMRVLSIVMMILGFMVAVWDPMFALASSGH